MKTLDAMVKLDQLSADDPQAAASEATDILLKFLKEHDGDCKEVAGALQNAKERCSF